jgi:hypothetical protein
MIISGLSPVGTTEQMGVVQPSLRDSIGSVRNPALKRWAGIVMSLRDAAPRPFGVRWQAQRDTAFSCERTKVFHQRCPFRKRRRRSALPAQSK